jgi:uncharacterized protein YndB with AHSA1/START domain
MPNIHHEVLIIAAVEKVYQAITDQQGLSAWWTPYTKATSEIGSILRFAFGSGYFKEMKITELKPLEQVKWVCLTGADEWIGTTVSFQLETGDKEGLLNSHAEAKDQIQQSINGRRATLLTLHHDNWKEYTPMFAECNYTWGQFLRSLKLFCESGEGRPWPNQHRTLQ